MADKNPGVVICGLPVTCNPRKVKLRFESECNIHIEDIKIEPDSAEVTFLSQEVCAEFCKHFPKTIKFGTENHVLEIIKSTGSPIEGPVYSHCQYRGQSSSIAQKNLNKVHTWSSLEKLPECESGIIVQSQQFHSMTIEDVRDYFGSNKESHGGEIATTILMIDGLFITFKDEEVAKTVWNFRPHRINGKPVLVHLKSVPETYWNRLVVKPMQQSINEKDLCLLLRLSSEKNTQPKVTKYPSEAYLVVYKTGTDLRGTIENFSKTNPSFHISFLVRTDCVMMKPVPDCTDDEIRILFENEDRTSGGNVTRIDRFNSRLLVYFGSYKEAEAVVTSCHGEPLQIFGMSVNVRLYFHSLYTEHSNLENGTPSFLMHQRKKEACHSTNVLIESIDRHLADFLKTYPEHFNSLNVKLQGIGQGKVTKRGVEIILISNSDEREDTAKNIVGQFSKCYSSMKRKICSEEQGKVVEAKSNECRKHPNELRITWLGDGDEVVVTGLKSEVQSFFKSFQPFSKDNSMLLEPEEVRWIVETGVFDDLQKKFPCIVSHTEERIIITGKLEEVADAQNAIRSLLQKIVRREFQSEHIAIMKFLASADEKHVIYANVTLLMMKENMCTILVVKNKMPYLFGLNETSDMAQVILRSALLCDESLQLTTHGKDAQAEAWREITPLELEGKIRTSVQENLVICIAGFHEHVTKAKEELSRCLVIHQKAVKVELGALKHLKLYCDFKKLCDAHSVTHEIKPGNVIFKGDKEAVEAVATCVKKTIQSIFKNTTTIEKFGLSDFLEGSEGQAILSHARQKQQKLTIIPRPIPSQKPRVDSNDHLSKKVPQVEIKPADVTGRCLAMIGKLRVSVRQGDITEDDTDAIVNCVSHTFDLSEGSLSQEIKKKGGDIIERELRKKYENDIRLTSSGRLSCKKVFHVAFPTSTEEVIKCFVKLLAQADEKKCTSISIPAFKTGAGRLDIDKLARLIGRGLRQFVSENKKIKNLTAVDIVLLNGDQVQCFSKEFITAIDSGTDVITSQPVSQVTGHVESRHISVGKPLGCKIGSITVSVRQGDITDERNHAIVNSTGAKFDLSKGFVSQAIAKKGGPLIQQEVSSLRGQQLRVTDAGHLKCVKIIHVVTPAELLGIDKLLKKILATAEGAFFPTLSIPAIGTGNLNLPAKDVANTMIAAIESFVQKNSKLKYLKKIDFVIYQTEHVEVFKAALLGRQIEETAVQKSDCFEFAVYSFEEDKHLAEKALDYLEDQIQEGLSSAILDDEINSFGKTEDELLANLGKKYHVIISRCDGQIGIEGLMVNRIEAEREVQNLLKEFVLLPSKPLQPIWEYQDTKKELKKFSAKDTDKLEQAYQNYLAGASPAIVCVSIDKEELRVNLRTMRMKYYIVQRRKQADDANSVNPEKLPFMEDHFGKSQKLKPTPPKASKSNSARSNHPKKK